MKISSRRSFVPSSEFSRSRRDGRGRKTVDFGEGASAKNLPACGVLGFGTESAPADNSMPRSRKGAPAIQKSAIRIAVVDDHKFYRELISRALMRQSDRYDVVAEVGDAEHAIAACQQHTPDLLILDINLPGMSGVEAVPAIRNASPKTRILLCTAYVDDDRVIDALRSGAHGFVEKTNSWDDFIEAVTRVARGEQYFCSTSNPLSGVPSPASPVRRSADQPISLSPREQEVLAGIARGSTTKEIAAELGLSFGTVDTHRTNLMRKLGIRNIAGLVVYAFRIGLIDVGSHGAKQRHMPTKAEQ